MTTISTLDIVTNNFWQYARVLPPNQERRVRQLYRMLLRLYPASFRNDYAAELERTFEERISDTGQVAKLFAAIGDVVPNALAMHWSILMQDLHWQEVWCRRYVLCA